VLIRFLRRWLDTALVSTIWLFCLCVIASGFLLILQQEESAKSSDNAATYETERDKTDRAIARYTRSLAIGTAILAACTGVLAIVSVVQGFQLGKQLKLAREEFTASQPPLLITRRFQFRRLSTDKWGVEFVIVNEGLTTATIIEDTITIGCFGAPIVDMLKQDSFPAYNPVPNVLEKRKYAPLERQAQFVHITNMTDESSRQVTEGQVILLAYGRIKYTDPTNVERASLFWREYNPSTRRFQRYNDQDYDNSDQGS
jgi:hypothetical protein